MNICFLCGSLEVGRDGVGDYVRRIAIQLIKEGHFITAIALADQFITEKVSCTQRNEGTDLLVLRIPANTGNKAKFLYANEWITFHNPQWVSLQFVPFAFNPKGLPFLLGSKLKQLGKGRLWHIMFHELWVGMDENCSKKHKWWGKVQRFLIKSLVEKLKPQVIHSQSKLYIAQLAKLSVNAEYLQLFSNIPVPFNNQHNSASYKNKNRSPKEIKFVIFGAVHPNNLLHELIEEAIVYSKKNKTTTSLTLIGRIGQEKDRWIREFKAANFKVEVLGEQSQERVSNVLANSTIGISTCSYPIIDKSGTVAAMLEHKLPVLCAAKPWYPRGINFTIDFPGIFILEQGVIESCMSFNHSTVAYSSVSDISKQLINGLSIDNN